MTFDELGRGLIGFLVLSSPAVVPLSPWHVWAPLVLGCLVVMSLMQPPVVPDWRS